MNERLHTLQAVLVLLAGTAIGASAEERLHARKLVTPGGVPFGIVGEKGASPKPTLIIFANTIERSLEDSDFNRMGTLLRQRRGFVLVALDMPSHGQDQRPGEPKGGLAGWRERLTRGEDVVAAFVPKVTAVLDFLIADGTTDRSKVGVCGNSRGGFMALQFAAADSRVKWAVAFSPVTDLLALEEFNGMAEHAMTRSLSLARVSSRLAGLPIWMSIGNNDRRVGTDHAITLSRRIMEETLAQGKVPRVELHIYATPGHLSIPAQHDSAADWFVAQMDRKE